MGREQSHSKISSSSPIEKRRAISVQKVREWNTTWEKADGRVMLEGVHVAIFNVKFKADPDTSSSGFYRRVICPIKFP